MANHTVSAALRVLVSLTGNRHTVGSILQVTSQPVSSFAIPLFFVGRTYSSSLESNEVSTKSYIDKYYEGVAVTQKYVDGKVEIAKSDRLLWSDFQNQINATDGSGNLLYPKRSTVTSRQANYINYSTLGFAGGIAKANTDGTLASAHVPQAGIVTENVGCMYNGLDQANYLSSGARTVSSSAPTEYLAASFTIPDPGYTYTTFNFVHIMGKSGQGSQASRESGTSNYGQIIVSPDVLAGQSPNILSRGLAIDSPNWNFHTALPTGTTGSSSPTAPFSGSVRLNVFLSNFNGSGYIFAPDYFTWIIYIAPVISQP